MQKLYCYVDETGQDTEGTFFIVSVVVSGDERDKLQIALEAIEQETGKKNVKWSKAKDDARIAHVKAALALPDLSSKLCYAVYEHTKDYLPKVVLTTARAVSLHVHEENYKATIIVDGLQKAHILRFGKLLRELDVRTRKIRDVKDETEPLIRLADTLSGFVRSAIGGRKELRELLDRAKPMGSLESYKTENPHG